ncbi:MAG: methyl-accepting chemotaxis protein [Deltaproteobacteria bacterium]|nr:methyl-accepting chemotaxis protein [Deltaproteobacteria bacterium]
MKTLNLVHKVNKSGLGIQSKLMAVILLITLTNLAVVAITYQTLRKQEDDANILNRTGQQRATAQQMAKEAMMIAAGADAEFTRQTLDINQDLFDKTLRGMIEGDESMGLKPIDNADFLAQLGIVQQLWAVHRPKYQNIIKNSVTSASFKDSLVFIQEHNLELVEEVNVAAFQYQEFSEGKIALLKQILVFGAVISFVITLLGWLLIFTIILKPIRQTVNMIKELEDGNLDIRLEMERGDEIGVMANALDQFADSLKNEVVLAFEKLSSGDLTFEAQGVIREGLTKTNVRLNDLLYQMRMVGEQIANGSAQVANASNVLSQGATEQAASLQEINASINELAGQTKYNASHATEANQFSFKAKEEAERGNRQMKSMVKAMEEINLSSGEISKIIKVIDEIAFQTNLLALNAAVEAGRAGRHGKGFAVVAGEVRNLAARSAKAAKETSKLIADSMKKVRAGGEIAEDTAKALEGVVGGIKKVSDLVGEIAVASTEQAEGIAQISNALVQIEKVTQSNTASAEQSASAAQEQASQSEVMRQMLSRFKLRNMPTRISTPQPVDKVIRMPGQGAPPKRTPGGQPKLELNTGDFGKY